MTIESDVAQLVTNTANMLSQVNASKTSIDLIANSQLMAWALTTAFRVVTATRNVDSAITTASIVWPNGVTGTYTALILSTAFPGATDSWRATYVAGTTKTVTQPAVTRDSNGAVTAQPAITIV